MIKYRKSKNISILSHGFPLLRHGWRFSQWHFQPLRWETMQGSFDDTLPSSKQ